MCVLLGEKHYEGCGICRLIHIVIFCLNYLMHYLCVMQSVNECCLLFRSVLIVTVTWFRAVLYATQYPLGRSALCCNLRYMFDIECLLCPQFNHCNVVRNFFCQLDRRNC